MRKIKTEQQLLKKLNIPDWRHMSKEKIIAFASTLPYINPEVAKKALEQFPEFTNLGIELISSLRNTLEKIYEENSYSEQTFYDSCNTNLEILKAQLDNNNLSFEQRECIINKMIDVSKMIGEKDTERKNFLIKTVSILSMTIGSIVIVAANILGSSTKVSDNETDEDDTST